MNKIRTCKFILPGIFLFLCSTQVYSQKDTAKTKIHQSVDPCNGTGGTGQIISIGNSTITIKRNDSVNEIINLTNKTTIKNSAGAIPKSDLKTGDRVTVVVMSHHTATVVLVCSATNSKP